MKRFMKLFFFIALLPMIWLLPACNGNNPKEEATLKKARQVHNEAMKIHDEIMDDYKKLPAIRAYLEDTLKKELRVSEITKEGVEKHPFTVAILECDQTEKAMKEWMKNIREVPGNEAHEHHSHEGHDHKHEPAPKAPADEILAYQEQMKKDIDKIKADIQALLKYKK